MGFSKIKNNKGLKSPHTLLILCSGMMYGSRHTSIQWCIWLWALPIWRKGKGKRYTRVYPPNEAVRRTQDHVVECGEMAIEDGVTHVFGVKTVLSLILLDPSTGFDMVNSFPVDYMHCVVLGVTKQFLDPWFNSKHHNSPSFIGTINCQFVFCILFYLFEWHFNKKLN